MCVYACLYRHMLVGVTMHMWTEEAGCCSSGMLSSLRFVIMKDLFIQCVCVCACVSSCMQCTFMCLQKPEEHCRSFPCLRTGPHVWLWAARCGILGTEPGSSANTVRAFDLLAISLDPILFREGLSMAFHSQGYRLSSQLSLGICLSHFLSGR